jgi:hypothetical protein
MPRIQSASAKQKPSNSQLNAFFSDASALRSLYDRDAAFRKRVDVAIGSSSELTRPWARQLGLPDYADESTILAALSARLRGGAVKKAASKPAKTKTVAAPQAKPARKPGPKVKAAARPRGAAKAVDNTKLRGDIEQRLRGAGAKGMRAEELSLPFRAIKPAYKRELEKLIADRRISKRGDRRKTMYSWLG